MATIELYNGNCLTELQKIADNSIDSIVTDPPYGIQFLSQKWDYDVPSVEIWKECFRVLKPGGYLLSFSGSRTYHRMAGRIEDAGFLIKDQLMWIYGSGMPKGSNLKPAHEPIVMARKGNVGMKLNVNDCRTDKGRYPSNRILDEVAGKILDEQSGITKSVKRGEHNNKKTEHTNTYTPKQSMYGEHNTYDDEGGASRFFYSPKANKKDKGKDNSHPTVKPTTLMEYLIKLVTPKDGIVLDPFMGSGSTGKGALLNDYSFVGIELSPEYFAIAESRINAVKNKTKFWC